VCFLLQLMACLLFHNTATHAFLFQDWMNAGHGVEVAKQLNSAGVPCHVERVGPAGHHVYLEAPTRFNAVVRTELSAILRGDNTVSSLATDPSRIIKPRDVSLHGASTGSEEEDRDERLSES
jgi:hypothetical protein